MPFSQLSLTPKVDTSYILVTKNKVDEFWTSKMDARQVCGLLRLYAPRLYLSLNPESVRKAQDIVEGDSGRNINLEMPMADAFCLKWTDITLHRQCSLCVMRFVNPDFSVLVLADQNNGIILTCQYRLVKIPHDDTSYFFTAEEKEVLSQFMDILFGDSYCRRRGKSLSNFIARYLITFVNPSEYGTISEFVPGTSENSQDKSFYEVYSALAISNMAKCGRFGATGIGRDLEQFLNSTTLCKETASKYCDFAQKLDDESDRIYSQVEKPSDEDARSACHLLEQAASIYEMTLPYLKDIADKERALQYIADYNLPPTAIDIECGVVSARWAPLLHGITAPDERAIQDLCIQNNRSRDKGLSYLQSLLKLYPDGDRSKKAVYYALAAEHFNAGEISDTARYLLQLAKLFPIEGNIGVDALIYFEESYIGIRPTWRDSLISEITSAVLSVKRDNLGAAVVGEYGIFLASKVLSGRFYGKLSDSDEAQSESAWSLARRRKEQAEFNSQYYQSIDRVLDELGFCYYAGQIKIRLGMVFALGRPGLGKNPFRKGRLIKEGREMAYDEEGLAGGNFPSGQVLTLDEDEKYFELSISRVRGKKYEFAIGVTSNEDDFIDDILRVFQVSQDEDGDEVVFEITDKNTIPKLMVYLSPERSFRGKDRETLSSYVPKHS